MIPGQGGLAKRVLVASDGGRGEAYAHGAHVTSWIPADGEERIFLSARSEFAPGKAIRGGVPIIFPQFDREGPLPRHGFARVSEWQSSAAGADDSDPARAVFRLSDSPASRSIWNERFVAELTVTVGGRSLALALTVTNTGTAPFAFTGALHTYLRVRAIEDVAVDGLGGIEFRDKVAGGVVRTQAPGVLRIEAETDRVYVAAPDRIVVHEPDRALVVEKRGFPDVVLWNPWDKGAALSDLEPEGYRHMLCVEAAAVSAPVRVGPGRKWSGGQGLALQSVD